MAQSQSELAPEFVNSQLSPGTKLGRYEIRSQLGAGGMGEVYLALDTELDRTVALKVLPSHLASDQQRMRRFMQEAKAASSLNHQNIITIYEIGGTDSTRFIATELIDGVTLRQRLKSGSVDVHEVFEIGIQIASGLAAAHEAGIVHRDIKPENIMLRKRDGFVKVLDFGLVKLTESPATTADTEAPTRALVNTDAGTVMGTVLYMSPEQARGKPVDERTDIWSLGVILYEMVTGVTPFSGDTSADVIAAIVKSEPTPIARFAPNAPDKLWEIINKALEKDRDDRYQTIKDLLVDLRRLKKRLDLDAEIDRSVPNYSQGDTLQSTDPVTLTRSAASTVSAEAPRPTTSAEYLISEIKRHRTGAILAVLAIIAVLALGAVVLLKFIGKEKAPPTGAMKITKLTSGGRLNNLLIDGSTSISPDGKYVVFTLLDEGKVSIWVRQVSTGSDVQIVPAGPLRNNGTTISNDGEFVYYIAVDRDTDSRMLFQVPLLGGTPRKILNDVPAPISFSPDGKQFAFVRSSPHTADALMVANIDGSGARSLATRRGNDWFNAEGVSWSPDGKTIAVAAGTDTGGTSMTVMGYSLSDGTLRPLTSKKWSGAVRRLIWLKDGSGLVVAALDNPGTLRRSQLWFISQPDGIARRITNDLNGYGGVSLGVSDDTKTLVTVQSTPSVQIWTTNAGEPADKALKITHGEVDGASGIVWLPNGNIIFVTQSGDTQELWISKPDGTDAKRLGTVDETTEILSPSSDGRYIFYTSLQSGIPHIWRMNVDGSELKQITSGDYADFAPACSPDGRWVLFSSFRSGKQNLWRVSVDGGEPQQLTDKFVERGSYSPDGKFIAAGEFLTSDGATGKIAILSSEGGEPLKLLDPPSGLNIAELVWSNDGKSLVVRGDRNGASNLWGLPLEGGAPKQLTNFTSDLIYGFAVSPDGKRYALARGNSALDIVLIRDFR